MSSVAGPADSSKRVGHRADKATWIYIVGIEPGDLPAMPLRLGRSTHVIAQGRTRKDGTRIRKGDAEWRPEVTKAEREHTPAALAAWLVTWPGFAAGSSIGGSLDGLIALASAWPPRPGRGLFPAFAR